MQSDVLIVGGGIVGLTATLAMAKKGYTVSLIDAGPLNTKLALNGLRVYAINQASQALFEVLNVWSALDLKKISPYQGMHVWDGQNGASIDFDARTIASSHLGYIVLESLLKEALFQEIARNPNIHLFPNFEVENIQHEDLNIIISSQNQFWQGRLLMVADGANSPCRNKLKVDLTTWSYHQQAIVASVLTEKPHDAKAYQVFHADGPLAFLPLAHNNQCSIVWSTQTIRAQHLLSLDEIQFNTELNKAFGGRLGQVQLNSARVAFPLKMRHVKQYSGPHWLLMGDAAHTIHPLAGLGLNLGLADIISWMNCLEGGKGFSKKQLAAYQRERKHAVWQMILLMEGFKRFFSYSFKPTVFIRGLGLSACNQITPLKRLMIQHAAGIG